MNLGPTTAQLHLKALNSLKPPPQKNTHAAPPRPVAKATPKSAPKPATKTISIQHMTVQKAKSNQRMLYDIVNYLKNSEKPVSAETIHEATGHDIKTIPGMMETLQSNVKIAYDDGWFSYKVIFPFTRKFSF
jgi:TFIIE beta subunit core domain